MQACYDAGMRTTIDLRDDQREALAAMAARRGLRGYSALVQDAVDMLLTRRDEDEGLAAVLELEGMLSDGEADELEATLAELRSERWRNPLS